MRTVQSVISLLLSFALAACLAANPSIGVAIARGSFEIDHSTVYGNSTLFEGSSINTAVAGSELRLSNGVQMQLGSDTAGRIYRDRLVLERGESQIATNISYRIEARNLRISPASAQSTVRVALTPEGRIQVAAVSGGARVSKPDGVLLARVFPGRAVELEPQTTSTTATKLAGVLEKKGSEYFLTDSTSGVTVQLIGSGLEKNVGKRVEVTGSVDTATQAAAGASQVVRVASVKVISAAAGGAAGAAASGMAVGTKVMIAGVLIAGAGTGIGIGVTRGEDKPTVSR